MNSKHYLLRFLIATICVLAVLTPFLMSCRALDRCGLAENATGRITDGILVTLQTNTASIAPGQSVQLSLSVADVTDLDKSLVFMSGQQYEFYVLDNAGNAVWTWSEYNGIAFTQAIMNHAVLACSYYPLYEPMGGGARRNTISVYWNGEDNAHEPLRPGTYTVYAALTTASPRESNRTVISLEAAM